MIMTVSPRFEGYENGTWIVTCALCEGRVGKRHPSKWSARRVAAQHLNSHRNGRINLEEARARSQRQREAVEREIEQVKRRRQAALANVEKQRLRDGLPPRLVTGRCPNPDKYRHYTEAGAQAHIDDLERNGKGSPDFNVYACQCGWYHIGHSRELFDKRLRAVLKGR